MYVVIKAYNILRNFLKLKKDDTLIEFSECNDTICVVYRQKDKTKITVILDKKGEKIYEKTEETLSFIHKSLYCFTINSKKYSYHNFYDENKNIIKYKNSRGFEYYIDNNGSIVNNLTDEDYIIIAKIKGLYLSLLNDDRYKNRLYYDDNNILLRLNMLLRSKWYYGEKDIEPIMPPKHVTAKYINILDKNIKFLCDEIIEKSIFENILSYNKQNSFLKDLKELCKRVMIEK